MITSSSDTWLVRRSTRVVSTTWSGFAERTARKPATGRRVLSGRGLLTEVILSNKRHNRDCVGLTKAKVNSLPGQMYVLGKDGPSLRDSCGRKTQAWQRLLNRPTLPIPVSVPNQAIVSWEDRRNQPSTNASAATRTVFLWKSPAKGTNWQFVRGTRSQRRGAARASAQRPATMFHRGRRRVSSPSEDVTPAKSIT